DERVELGADVAVLEIELRLAAGRERRLALGLERLEIPDVLVRLLLFLPRLLEPGGRGELRRAGLVDLVRGHELAGQERLETVEIVRGVLELRLHALHARPGGRDGESLALDLALRDLDLAVERRDVGPRALDGELVRARVDDEEQVPLL